MTLSMRQAVRLLLGIGVTIAFQTGPPSIAYRGVRPLSRDVALGAGSEYLGSLDTLAGDAVDAAAVRWATLGDAVGAFKDSVGGSGPVISEWVQTVLRALPPLPAPSPEMRDTLDALEAALPDEARDMFDALGASMPEPLATAAPGLTGFIVTLSVLAMASGGGGASVPGPESPYPLNVYDPVTARAYFAQRPSEVAARASEIGVRASGFLAAVALDFAGGALDSNADKRAAELVKLLTALGPTFIKVGQTLSTRTDLVSPPYLLALSQLQVVREESAQSQRGVSAESVLLRARTPGAPTFLLSGAAKSEVWFICGHVV